MRHAFGKIAIIALGGSIVYPEEIDTEFLRRFKKFVESLTRRGMKVVLVVGGGKICRVYQRGAHAVSPLADEDKDWLGIHVTRLNAHLIRTIFRRVADPVVIDERYKIRKLKYPVTIAGGWRPGWSTDFVAMALAYDLGAKEAVIAGKPDHVYNKDPHKFKGAKPYVVLPWKEYRKLIPAKWVPGAHAPVDPVAARLGDEQGVKAIVIDGRDLKNFQKLLSNQEFKGTIVG